MRWLTALTAPAALGLSGPPFHGRKLPGRRGPRSRGGEDRAPAAQGGGLSVPHYPMAAPRRARVIGACGLALCYPMWPRAKPPTRAALAAAAGPEPLVAGRHLRAPAGGAGPRVADRGDTQPQPRSIRPTASRI